MTSWLAWRAVLLIVLSGCFAGNAAGATQSDLCLAVNAFVVSASDESQDVAMVAVRPSRSCRVSRVWIELVGGETARPIEERASSGRATLTFRSSAGSRRDDLAVRVRYVGRDYAGSVAFLVRAKSKGSKLPNTALGFMLGFLGTAGGVVIAELFARRRERVTREANWNLALFDRYEAGYRTFLSTWNGASSAPILMAAFAQLRKDVVVPEAIVAKYEATLAVVRTGTVAEKEEATHAFNADVSRLLLSATALTTG